MALFAACGGSDSGSTSGEGPANLAMSPVAGFATDPVAVVITGTGFAVKTVQVSSGGTPTLDTSHRAWLGSTAVPVVWEDSTTLRGTVPAGLAPGSYDLTIENALGERGTVKAAYTVLPGAPFSAALQTKRATVNTGQAFALEVTIANRGASAIRDLALGTPEQRTTDGASVVTGPAQPSAPATLEAGAQQTFTWNCTAGSQAGRVELRVTVTGTDAATGKPVTAALAAPLAVTIQKPAALTASLGVSPSVAVSTEAVENTFDVTLTVRNTGGALARGVVPAALPATLTGTGTPPATATLRTAPPTAPVDIAAGTDTTFRWTYVAGRTGGTLTVSGSATGADANSGAALTATATPGVTTLAQAAIVAAVVPPAPTTLSAGTHPFSVTIRVTNPGTVAINSFRLNAPTASGGIQVVSSPSAPPATLGAGQSTDPLTWTFTAPNPGAQTITFTQSGVDSSTGQPRQGSVSVPVVITSPATLSVATFTATPSPVRAGAAVSVTLELANAPGAGAASVASVTPSIAPATATCTAASAEGTGQWPVTVAAGARARFTWTCTPTAAGAYTLGATVVASDATTGESAAPTVAGQTVTANPQPPAAAPGTPTFGATTTTSVVVSWTAAAGATSYKLERAPDTGAGPGAFAQIAAPAATSFTDSQLAPGTTYWYRVTGTNAGGDGPASVAAAVTTVVGAPGAPGALTLTAAVDATSGALSVTVGWSAVAGATSYEVERAVGVAPPATWTLVNAPTAPTYADRSVARATTYWYRVRARNAGGPGDYSPTGSVVTPN